MSKYIPTIYKKSIFDIPYDSIKKQGIKYLLFDLDNTLVKARGSVLEDDVIDLIQKLKKDFIVIMVSNSGSKRVVAMANLLDIDYVAFSRKPSHKAFNIVSKKYNSSKESMAIIGDQLLTDIKAGNTFGIMTILIDRIDVDRWVTIGNRLVENMMLKSYAKRGILERGKYYE